LSPADRGELQKQLTQLSRDASIQELVASTLNNEATSVTARLLSLRVMAGAQIKTVPGAWNLALQHALENSNEAVIRAAVTAVRALPVAKSNAFDFSEQLLRVARDNSRPRELRVEALAAMAASLANIEPDIFDLLRASLDAAQPPSLRSTAAAVLGRAKPTDDQLLALCDSLKAVGPLEITKLLSAYDSTTNEMIGLRFAAALKESKGFGGLRVDLLKPRFEKFSPAVQHEGEALLALLNVDAAKQKAHLEDLAANLKSGDIRRGQLIFNSPKAACFTCHALGYLGGKVGPDLTSIGQIRSERDLLEAIVYPSASFVRSYEPMIVATKSGEEFSGVLRRDSPDEVVLATGAETEARIARADIAEMRPGAVSVMPTGLDEQLTRQELADLVTFLKGTKWGAQ
jgi:putative heme-binding domain-containing protein